MNTELQAVKDGINKARMEELIALELLSNPSAACDTSLLPRFYEETTVREAELLEDLWSAAEWGTWLRMLRETYWA